MDLIASHGGLIDVHSDQRECTLMDTAVRTPEIPLHKPHIRGQERQPQYLSGFCVGLRHEPVEVREPDKAVEVGNGNWFRIDWIDRGRGKHVIRPAENGRTTGDGNGRERHFRSRQSRPEQPGAERTTKHRRPGSGTDEPTPRHRGVRSAHTRSLPGGKCTNVHRLLLTGLRAVNLPLGISGVCKADPKICKKLQNPRERPTEIFTLRDCSLVWSRHERRKYGGGCRCRCRTARRLLYRPAPPLSAA